MLVHGFCHAEDLYFHPLSFTLQVNACKRNMNTFAFVGNLENNPEVSCVYHSEEAENQFLKNPSRAVLGDGYAPPSRD